MKRILASTLFITASLAVINAAEPQIGTGETNGYVLVWQDLFDGDELNRQRWNIEVNGSGGGNNELQYYTDSPDNVSVGDDGQGNGCLILTARREEHKGRHFTSGRINSRDRITFTHGKMEASIKLPKTANGLWPAFWMMGNDYGKVGWPRCGETDILEMGNAEGINNNVQERFFNGACHWGQSWPAASYAKSSTKSYSLQDGEFHLYTIIWDEDVIKMYVDHDKYPKQNYYYKLDCPCDDPDNEWSPGNYFHKPNFIIFNLAVGGDFTGIHDHERITALNDDNDQQASVYVNYVKIYQRGDESETLDVTDPGDSTDVSVATTDCDGTLSYDGCNLCSSHCITLYTMVGVKVAESASGVLSTAGYTPGIYLASAGSDTRKILVR